MTAITDEMIGLLPSLYAKSSDSNVYKLLDLFGQQLEKMNTSNDLISTYYEIDQASGKTLDFIGRQYGVTRLTNDDTFYRFLIKAHIEMSLRVGTANELIKVLSSTSGLPMSSFNVVDGDEPMSIAVVDMPAALTPDEATQNLVKVWIQSVLPAGIRLSAISFREASNSELAMGAVIEQSQLFHTPTATLNIPGV
ncbi:MAG: hypothetical protein ACRC9Z_10535 [Weissella confusa]